MSIQIVEVQNQRQRKEFVNLPFTLYKDNEFWVPPFKSGELNFGLPLKMEKRLGELVLSLTS